MKTHKFLIIVGDSEWAMDSIENPDMYRIVYNEEHRLKVIECQHEKFEDNCVEIDDVDDCGGHTFVKDIEGRLWYFDDAWSKIDVINAFESSNG